MTGADRGAIVAHAALAAASLVAFVLVRPPLPVHGSRSAGLLGAAGRWGYWAVRPFAKGGAALGLSADAVTLLGLALSVAAGAAAAAGAWGWSGILLLWGGLCDMIDGELARGGAPTDAGAFLDSNADRLGEAALLLGIAAGLPDRRGALAAMAALATSLLVSYARARGEGLGVSCPSFGWERPHRLAVFLIALLVAPFLPAARAAPLLALASAAVAAGAGLTALGRIVLIRRLLLRRGAGR